MDKIMEWAQTLPDMEKEALLAVIATISLNRACLGTHRSAFEILEVSAKIVRSH